MGKPSRENATQVMSHPFANSTISPSMDQELAHEEQRRINLEMQVTHYLEERVREDAALQKEITAREILEGRLKALEGESFGSYGAAVA